MGFQRVDILHGSTYRDNSTIVIVPGRDEMIHHRVFQTWQNLMPLMNQKRTFVFIIGHEVGVAYNNAIQHILQDPELSKWKYILTLETDNLVPPDAHIQLLKTLDDGKYDGVSGLYWTKGDVNMPMAYGDPEMFRATGVMDFIPRDVREPLAKGDVMEVNGIAMGCSLYRLDLFREVPPPWFVTVAKFAPGVGIQLATQDLNFCEKARRLGKRFAVDMNVRVGHIDVRDGTVY